MQRPMEEKGITERPSPRAAVPSSRVKTAFRSAVALIAGMLVANAIRIPAVVDADGFEIIGDNLSLITQPQVGSDVPVLALWAIAGLGFMILLLKAHGIPPWIVLVAGFIFGILSGMVLGLNVLIMIVIGVAAGGVGYMVYGMRS